MRFPHRFIRPVHLTIVPLRAKATKFPNGVFHDQSNKTSVQLVADNSTSI